jgi:hypothetical protein
VLFWDMVGLTFVRGGGGVGDEAGEPAAETVEPVETGGDATGEPELEMAGEVAEDTAREGVG